MGPKLTNMEVKPPYLGPKMTYMELELTYMRLKSIIWDLN